MLAKQIIACQHCHRLRNYCAEIAATKRKAYLNETYWGKPITGFGDTQARLVIVGLAPGAHGANRTGRVFTGDRSGDWLYRALFRAGFANQPHSTNRNDGLKLRDAYITCIVKCAPPDNKPLPEEEKRCADFLVQEFRSLRPTAKVWIALGQLAAKRTWALLRDEYGAATQNSSAHHAKMKIPTPTFAHGAEIRIPGVGWLLLSYHPSQQNTFTGKLTEPMFDSVFNRAREILWSLNDFQIPESTPPKKA